MTDSPDVRAVDITANLVVRCELYCALQRARGEAGHGAAVASVAGHSAVRMLDTDEWFPHQVPPNEYTCFEFAFGLVESESYLRTRAFFRCLREPNSKMIRAMLDNKTLKVLDANAVQTGDIALYHVVAPTLTFLHGGRIWRRPVVSTWGRKRV